jgi:hypothetical protein
VTVDWGSQPTGRIQVDLGRVEDDVFGAMRAVGGYQEFQVGMAEIRNYAHSATPLALTPTALEASDPRGWRLGAADEARRYPVYGMLLYTAESGLDAAVHRYVSAHWHALERLTGDDCLIFALEDISEWTAGEETLGRLARDEVYDIARMLKVNLDALPALALFVEPDARQKALILALADWLPSDDPSDAELNRFFRLTVQQVISVSGTRASKRLDKLGRRLESARRTLPESWTRDRGDGEGAAGRLHAVATIVTDTRTIANAAIALGTLPADLFLWHIAARV